MTAPWIGTSLVPEKGHWSFPAGSASLQQFQFVSFNPSGQLITPTASTSYALVLDDAPNITSSGATLSNGEWSGGYVVGQYYSAVFMGIVKVIAGGSITAGTQVMSDTSGHAVTLTSPGTNFCQGIAWGSASSGDLVSVLLSPHI